MRRPSLRAVLLLGLCALPSCAWANPDNRPIWNAFENNAVPESDGLFYATLPATVPLGLGAVLLDTFVAHPIQVIDDAVEDAGVLWEEDDPDFEDAYYTEMAYLPFRVTFTPLLFTGSFISRSLFDIPERMTSEEREAKEQRQEERMRKGFVTWLWRLGRGSGWPSRGWPGEWHPDFAAPLQAALKGDANKRRALHDAMIGYGLLEFGDYDAKAALRDADPVVRYLAISRWPKNRAPTELLPQLRTDPIESVRLMTIERFGN